MAAATMGVAVDRGKREGVTQMAWESRGGSGRYYTRSRKEDGRVIREYIGGGIVGELAAEADKLDRAERHAERARLCALEAERAALAESLRALHAASETLARATLLAAGYRQHHRGEWRKRRDSNNGDGASEARQ